MPFELRHVNVYLLRDGDAYTLIDTGLQTEESRQVLNQQLAGLKVPIKRINRILITHIHPDHFGLAGELRERSGADRKSTRLNSSHRCISYAVFCLKKEKPWRHGANGRTAVVALNEPLPVRLLVDDD